MILHYVASLSSEWAGRSLERKRVHEGGKDGYWYEKRMLTVVGTGALSPKCLPNGFPPPSGLANRDKTFLHHISQHCLSSSCRPRKATAWAELIHETLAEEGSSPTKLAGDAGPWLCPTMSCSRGGCHSSGSQCSLRAIPASQVLVTGMLLISLSNPQERRQP